MSVNRSQCLDTVWLHSCIFLMLALHCSLLIERFRGILLLNPLLTVDQNFWTSARVVPSCAVCLCFCKCHANVFLPSKVTGAASPNQRCGHIFLYDYSNIFSKRVTLPAIFTAVLSLRWRTFQVRKKSYHCVDATCGEFSTNTRCVRKLHRIVSTHC